MKVHGLIALLTALWLHKAGTAAFDLDLAAGFLLDILDIVATATDNLCSQVKAADGLKTYGNLFLGPLALVLVSSVLPDLGRQHTRPYSSRSKFSGSRRRNRRSSTRLGRSSFIISSIICTAFSRPSLEVLVMRRYNGGVYEDSQSLVKHLLLLGHT